jgi:hypothetical protein
MSHRFAQRVTVKPIGFGRKTLKHGYLWSNPQSWLTRTEHALKSGAVLKPAALDAIRRVPPMPIPRRPNFGPVIKGRKSRRPPPIDFPEDRIKRLVLADPELQGLFGGRLHPGGQRVGRYDDSKDLGAFARPSQQLQADLRHSPLFLDKIARRFAAHHGKLMAKGMPDAEAYDAVKVRTDPHSKLPRCPAADPASQTTRRTDAVKALVLRRKSSSPSTSTFSTETPRSSGSRTRPT